MARKIGFVASCFDLFHAGHILMLKEAKENCDYLIVGLQTDPTIDRPQKNKPVQSIFERFTQLQACKYIDEIVIYSTEKDLLDLLQSYPIGIRFVGEEYKDKEFTGKNLGIPIHYNTRRHSFSTTELRSRVVMAEVDRLEKEEKMKREIVFQPSITVVGGTGGVMKSNTSFSVGTLPAPLTIGGAHQGQAPFSFGQNQQDRSPDYEDE